MPGQPSAQSWLRRKLSEVTLAECVMILLTFAIATSTITYTIYARRQWQELKSSGSDAHDLAVAAGKQAEAAKAQAESTDQIATRALAQAKATNNLAREASRSADIAQRTFNAANRPYVGVNGASADHFMKNEVGEFVPAPRPSAKTEGLVYAIEIKNFGPVPATNFVDSQRVFFNGVEHPTTINPPHRPSTIFPGQLVYFRGSISNPEYAEIMSGKIVVMIEIRVEYDGPSGHYKHCDRRQYNPGANGFLGLGVCPAE